jgi:hypothetical protein
MLLALSILLQVGFIVRVLLRPHRDPASRIAWIVVILALPVVGIVAYLLLGETNIGRKRVERMKTVFAALPSIASTPGFDAPNVRPEIHERHLPLFKVGQSISGFEPVGGNHASLMADSNAAIDAMSDTTTILSIVLRTISRVPALAVRVGSQRSASKCSRMNCAADRTASPTLAGSSASSSSIARSSVPPNRDPITSS